MQIHRYPLGQMQANCYVLEQDGQALLIDPGDSADFILEKIQQKRLELVGMVATHGHFDHIMAVGEIQLSYLHLALHMHAADTFLLKRVVETARHFLDYDPAVIPIQKNASLRSGSFSMYDFAFKIIHTPGHTPGSCCLFFQKEQVLFTGDTLFKQGIGRYDFSYSDKEALKQSLKKILALPVDIDVYPGHGEETTIEAEQGIIQKFF